MCERDIDGSVIGLFHIISYAMFSPSARVCRYTCEKMKIEDLSIPASGSIRGFVV